MSEEEFYNKDVTPNGENLQETTGEQQNNPSPDTSIADYMKGKGTDYDFMFSFDILKDSPNAIKKIFIGGNYLYAIFITLIATITAFVMQHYLLGVLLILVFFVMIFWFSFVVSGYCYKAAKNVCEGLPAEKVLPEWNERFCLIGLKQYITQFIFNLPFSLVFGFIAVILMILFFAATGGNFDENTMNMLSPIINLVTMPLQLIPLAFMPAVITLFIKRDFDITSSLRWVKATRLIKYSPKNYLFFLLNLLLIGIISFVAILACAISVIGILIIPYVLFASALLTTLIYGYFAKRTENCVLVKEGEDDDFE